MDIVITILPGSYMDWIDELNRGIAMLSHDDPPIVMLRNPITVEDGRYIRKKIKDAIANQGKSIEQ